jgi:hypothetical protein
MRKTLSAIILAAGISALCSNGAGAVPANPAAMREAANAGSAMQQVQYAERRARYGVVKCYRDFVVGPYRCHYFRGPL